MRADTLQKVTQTSYDVIPYTSFSFPQTHPDRLATVAALLGVQPAPVERCRVLELGCAGGGNIIPMAYVLPESEFVGLDAAARQVAEGQVMIAGVGLSNISLKHMDLLDVTPDFGQFDYIIAHGVYSWVPAAVQEKILEICRQNLAPNGVAYISYNTYPGWRLHSAIRDMMLYHTQAISDPAERITQARELLDFLAESVLGERTAHANFLLSYINYVKERFLPEDDDAYLFHNELSEFNEPLYFHQFVERAERHGLKYLAEADFQTMLASNLPQATAAKLQQMAKNTIALEQYMDFLRNRVFRQTLLCHQEVSLTGRMTPDRLGEFYLASSALPETSDLDIQSRAIQKFRAPNKDTFSTDHPVTKAAMKHLSDVWPQAVAFETLLMEACRQVYDAALTDNPNAQRDRQVLGANLLKAFSYNEDLVEFHVYAPPLALKVSERPVVSPVARFQAKSSRRVTNLRHELIDLTGLSYYLTAFLDGTWSRGALLEMLTEAVAEGALTLEQADQPLTDPTQIRENLPEMLDVAVRNLADAALLVA